MALQGANGELLVHMHLYLGTNADIAHARAILARSTSADPQLAPY